MMRGKGKGEKERKKLLDTRPSYETDFVRMQELHRFQRVKIQGLPG